MKKIFYTFLALVFVLVSCTEELETNNNLPADTIMLKVFNSPMTKATDPGSENERKINRLDCFFYNLGETDEKCVYYEKFENLSAIGQSEIKLNVTQDIIDNIFGNNAKCDVFVIANLPSSVISSLEGIQLQTGGNGTSVDNLSKIALALNNGYDDVDGPFVMAGLDQAEKDQTNNAEGTIPLYRAASKVTIAVTVPKEITATDGTVMVPIFEALNKDGEKESTLKASFHNGVTKSYLMADYDSENTIFHTNKKSFQPKGEIDGKYLYTCEVPFYTYARTWAKAAPDAAHITLELKWVEKSSQSDATSYKSYYYQVLVNGSGRCFEPNNWYDLTVNLGVLGSEVELDPKEVSDLTYYVLDWTTEPESPSGDRFENVDIKEYAYLVVPETKIVLNNVTTGEIRYNASHSIGIMMNTEEKYIELLDDKATTLSAYYVYCGPKLKEDGSVDTDSSGKPKTVAPEEKSLSITTSNYKDNEKGIITYNYTIPSSIYSPVYSYITIWLDLNGNKKLDTDEQEFTEDVEIVQYPPIYVTPDQTVQYSIFVNKESRYTKGDGTSRTDGVRFRHSNDNYYGLGVVPGTNSTTGETAFMYTITVSSLKSTDIFYYNAVTHKSDDNQNPPKPYRYIIGDPRSRISDTRLNNDNHNTNDNWATAPSIDGTERKLQYYYPTSSAPGAFQVIAPKFRVVSFHGNGHRFHNYEGAAMRCASYQEDGYPAGRWRLPTFAEIQFIVMLQENNVICPIFFGSSQYFTPTTQVSYSANGSSYSASGSAFTSSPSSDGGDGSVRCVYDEWYWGSEQEAIENTAANKSQGQEYVFTWGDKQIWDENGNVIN